MLLECAGYDLSLKEELHPIGPSSFLLCLVVFPPEIG